MLVDVYRQATVRMEGREWSRYVLTEVYKEEIIKSGRGAETAKPINDDVSSGLCEPVPRPGLTLTAVFISSNPTEKLRHTVLIMFMVSIIIYS